MQSLRGGCVGWLGRGLPELYELRRRSDRDPARTMLRLSVFYRPGVVRGISLEIPVHCGVNRVLRETGVGGNCIGSTTRVTVCRISRLSSLGARELWSMMLTLEQN